MYGVYFGFTEGVEKAFVADMVPAKRRGTAFGLFNLVTGGTLLAASALAGVLWRWFGPSTTFAAGAVFAALAAVGLMASLERGRDRSYGG